MYDVLVDVLTVFILGGILGSFIYELVMAIKERDKFDE